MKTQGYNLEKVQSTKSYMYNNVQKIQYKQHQPMGHERSFVESGNILHRSAKEEFEGRHYIQSMSMYKEAIASIV